MIEPTIAENMAFRTENATLQAKHASDGTGTGPMLCAECGHRWIGWPESTCPVKGRHPAPMKLEEVYPVTALHLARLRNPHASPTSVNDAAICLTNMGFGDHPEVVAAIRQATSRKTTAERMIEHVYDEATRQRATTTTVRVVAYDEAANDPAAMLEAIDSGRGVELDAVGVKLWPPLDRLDKERDRDYRVRLIKAVVSCRGSVHVLGPDPATWHHCQCGRTPGLTTQHWDKPQISDHNPMIEHASLSERILEAIRPCFFCGTWRDRAKLTEHTALAWTPETGETSDRLYACTTGICPAQADAFCKAARERYNERQRIRLEDVAAAQERYSAEQKPLKTNHVALVDKLRVGDEECRIRPQSGTHEPECAIWIPGGDCSCPAGWPKPNITVSEGVTPAINVAAPPGLLDELAGPAEHTERCPSTCWCHRARNIDRIPFVCPVHGARTGGARCCERARDVADEAAAFAAECASYPTSEPPDMVSNQFADLKERFAAIRAAWKGQPPITLDDEIDGVALRDLLELEEDERHEGPGLQLARLLGSSALSPAQRAAVSAYHSAQLRARIAESDAAAEARKLTVIVDRDLDEVE